MGLAPGNKQPEDRREWSRWCHSQPVMPLNAVKVILTAHTITDEDVILADDTAAGGAVTINLPPVAFNIGRVIHVKKVGNTGNVTLDGFASENIDGTGTNVISVQYNTISIVGDGTEWWVL